MARIVPVPVVPVVVWRVVALEVPQLRRHCPRCGGPRPFASSERFRVNANGRKLDVWLVYRCTHCDGTFNLDVHARVPAEALGGVLERYHHNDPALARAVAFDERLTRRGGRLDPVPFRVDVEPATPPHTAVLTFAEPFAVRLDRVVAEALGVGRARLKRIPDLDRPAREGQRIRVYGENDIRIVQ